MVALAAVAPASAAPPPNDAFAAAQVLAGVPPLAVDGTTLGATSEVGETGDLNHSVWYEWTPAADGVFRVDVCGAAWDSVLAVYTGSGLDNLALVAFNDDGCASASRLRVEVTAGTSYQIAVAGYSAGSSGPFTLRVTPTVPPPNDDLAAVMAAASLSVGSAPAVSAPTSRLTASIAPAVYDPAVGPSRTALTLLLEAGDDAGPIGPSQNIAFLFPEDLVLSSDAFEPCPAAQAPGFGPEACPPGAVVGTGSLEARLGSNVPIAGELTILRAAAADELIVFMSQTAGSLRIALIGRLAPAGEPPYGHRLTIEIPTGMQQPAPGVYVGITRLELRFDAVGRNGAGFVSLAGCAAGSLPFKSVDTIGPTPAAAPQPAISTAAAACSSLPEPPPAFALVGAFASSRNGISASAKANVTAAGVLRAVQVTSRGTLVRKRVLIRPLRLLFSDPGAERVRLRLSSHGQRRLQKRRRVEVFTRLTYTTVTGQVAESIVRVVFRRSARRR